MNLPQLTPLDGWVCTEKDVMARALKPGASYPKPVVNPAQWARLIVAEPDCQKQADTKAFTGRGKLLELRQLLTDLDELTQAMRQLAELTLQVPEGHVRLVLHVKKSTGLTFLRWREKTGACRHVPWPEVQGRIDGMVPGVREWFQTASEQAVELNERHKALRRAIAAARKVVMRGSPQVFPRSIQVDD